MPVFIAETIRGVVVNHPYRLHECIADGGADELDHVGKPEWAHSVLPFFGERFGYF